MNIRTTLVLAALLVWAGASEAACTGSSPTWTSTADRTSVNTCVNNAASGDTINVQAGSVSWGSPISLPATKDLTLIGATAVNCTGTPGSDTYACAATDSTTLTCSSGCFGLNLAASQRLAGFTMRNGSTNELVSCNGEQNASKHFRVDHNHFVSTGGWAPMRCKGQTNAVHPQGIWDHNRLEDVAIHTTGTLHQLDEGPYQHQLWAQNTPLGDSAGVVYVEANHFSGGPNNINSLDGNYGARAVIRFNRLSGQTYMEFHSPQGENRGYQRWEVYNNVLKDPSTTDCFFGLGFIRGGTGTFFGNRMSGNISDCNYDLILDNVRSEWAAGSSVDGIRACDGASPWDQNSSGQQGWHCRDQIGIARDFSQWNHSAPTAWNQEIKPAYFWNNTKPSNPNGTGSPIEITVTVDSSGRSPLHLQTNRDFYVRNASFNGTSGVGVGPVSARPATCTTNVAYWSTDEGEWNADNAGPDGQLYKCIATNTWTLYYIPHAYPHPWTGGVAPPPPPPAPACSLSSSNLNPVVGSSITLTATCTNNPTSYTWTGCTSTTSTCARTETTAGSRIYTVSASNGTAGAPTSVTVNWVDPPPNTCNADLAACNQRATNAKAELTKAQTAITAAKAEIAKVEAAVNAAKVILQ